MINKLKNNKTLNLILNIVKTITTIFLILLILIIAIQRFSNNHIAIGGIRVFTIITESMYPEYKVGDMIIAIDTAPDKIKIGDNVVYNGEVDDFKGKIVTHKVISTKKTSEGYKFITKGVNNIVEDPEINEKQIIGKVVYKTLILSFISKLVNNTTTFFVVIFIPFTLLVFLEILAVIKEREQVDEE